MTPQGRQAALGSSRFPRHRGLCVHVTAGLASLNPSLQYYYTRRPTILHAIDTFFRRYMIVICKKNTCTFTEKHALQKKM